MKRVDPGDGRVILCLNSGSSSVKLALFRLGKKETLLARGAAEQIGRQNSRLWIDDPVKFPPFHICGIPFACFYF